MNGAVAQSFSMSLSVITDLEMLLRIYKKRGEQGCSPPQYKDKI